MVVNLGLISFVALCLASCRAWVPPSSKLCTSQRRKMQSMKDVLQPIISTRGGDFAEEVCPATSTSLFVVSETAASLLSGAFAGSVGVGVAFPLDTLKTKAQVMEARGAGMMKVISHVYATEGVTGFFQGVRTTMFGQAFIKSTAFAANTFGLVALENVALPATAKLLLAACFSGFLTSFLVVPFERIKVMMQAASKGRYKNELDCLNAILRAEGFLGLMGRGLGPTLAREVPGYGFYFFVYGFLQSTLIAKELGMAAPLVFGALAGMAAWIPVYPIDVVKTLIQNTEGGESQSSWAVAADLYKADGIGAFFEGLTPKMLRAAVNHAVTFFVYGMVMESIFGMSGTR